MMHPVYSDFYALAPEIVLACGTMLLMVLGVFGRGGALKPVAWLAGLLWTGAIVYIGWHDTSETMRAFNDMIVVDQLARMAKILIAGGAIASLALAVADLKGTVMARFEYPVLMGFAVIGMFVMVSANDLLTLYMGLELSSLAMYVMAAFDRNNPRSSEAGLKYFVLGALSSGMLLFGASLIYGFVGATQFDLIRATLGASAVPGPVSVAVLFGMMLIVSAIAFKVAAVPFHMWTPDVYEGSPTSVTAFFAMVPKLAALVLLARLMAGPFAPLMADLKPVIVILSVASMVVGAFAAIVQTNFKRLLAYSSIGNIGYALLGLAAGNHMGLASMVVYMTIYMAMTAGTFGIMLLLRRDGVAVERIADFTGLSRTHPVAAYAMAALMFSMSGIPPLAGFFGKFMVFQSIVAAQGYTLAVIGVVTSVVAAWYYLNIIRVMFFDDAPAINTTPIALHQTLGGRAIVVASLLFVVGYVLFPNGLAVWAANATAGFLP